MSRSERRQREAVIKVRATDRELATIRSHAAKAGQQVATYLRNRGLDGVGGGVPRRDSRRAIIATLSVLGGELGRIGNNLNQVARAMNAGQVARSQDLDSALADLARALASIVGAIEEL